MAERLYRFQEVSESDFDAHTRTLRVAFSSETPVLRVGSPRDTLVRAGEEFYEVLDHSPENVDLSALNNSGPFLDEHKVERQLGKVKSARIDTDRVGRAELVYDEHQLANERHGQMRSRTRPHISAGYRWRSIVGKSVAADGLPVYRFSWIPDEVSSVAIPADGKVGVGRSAELVDSPEKLITENLDKLTSEQKKRMKILLDAGANGNGGGGGAATITAEDVTKARSAAIEVMKHRNKQITTIADLLIKDHGDKDNGQMKDKIRSMTNEALAGDEEVGAFQIRCMQEVIKAKPATPTLIADCANPKDAKQYSLLRGIQSAAKHRMAGKEGIPDGLEGEVHQEIHRRAAQNAADGLGVGLGYEASGFQVPCDAPIRAGTGNRKTRDMQATIFNAGGAFVPTQLMVPIIELLRNLMVLDAAGVRTMAGLQGNIVIPRQEAAATAYSVSEIGALTASQQILGQIALTPKRVGATQNYSKQFVMQSTPDAEAFMRDDLLKVIALSWDYLGLNGQGAASQPLGIINTPGVGSVHFGATPTYIKMVNFETQIRSANVMDPITYMSTPTVKGTLKTVAEALTGATTIGGAQNAIWKAGDVVNGYPALASNQIPNNLVIAGAFNQLIHAMWGGLDVVVDYYTKAVNAEIAVTINTWGDFAVRHPQAFVISDDAGNQ